MPAAVDSICLDRTFSITGYSLLLAVSSASLNSYSKPIISGESDSMIDLTTFLSSKFSCLVSSPLANS